MEWAFLILFSARLVGVILSLTLGVLAVFFNKRTFNFLTRASLRLERGVKVNNTKLYSDKYYIILFRISLFIMGILLILNASSKISMMIKMLE